MMKGMSTRLLGIVGLSLFCTSRLAIGGEPPTVVSQLTCTDTYSCCLQRNAGRSENCGEGMDSAAASAAAAAAIAELAVAINEEKLNGSTRVVAQHLARLLELAQVGGVPPDEDPNDRDSEGHWWKEIKTHLQNIQKAIKGARSRKQVMAAYRRAKEFTEEQIAEIETRLIEAARKMSETVPRFLPPE